jgi:hypothetical protein
MPCRQLHLCIIFGSELQAKKKKKTIVLKLDFKKAFDTVSWDCLFRVLEIRGFDLKWIQWMKLLTNSAKTAILLNGIPGPWIQIKRGIRARGSTLPLLFLVIADILQKVIQCFSSEGQLKHPLVADQTCPFIQYADGTLILIQGCPPTSTTSEGNIGCLFNDNRAIYKLRKNNLCSYKSG